MNQLLSSRPPLATDSMSDDELYTLIMNMDWNRTGVGYMPDLDVMGPPPVYHIKPYKLVAKHIAFDPWTEVYAMHHVHQHTTIPIPQVHRVIPDQRDGGRGFWLIMDFIDGECLLEAWPKLSWWRRFQVVCTLRSYIQQLHRAPLPSPDIPGPSDGTGRSFTCLGNHFDDGAGPFSTYAAMAAWHDHQNHRFQVLLHHQGVKKIWQYSKFDQSLPLVFCHFDLHMRNIMLDKNNRVWLIDWAFAGAYPAWFEYIPLGSTVKTANPMFSLPRSFAWFIGFIVGGCCAPWYYDNYIGDFYLRIESYRKRLIDSDYFVKQGIDPKLWQPADVARPSLPHVMVQRCFDIVYDTFLVVRGLFVPL
ncbi:kinase-like domain-containing protein [Lentinula lateritia]|uniref:Kinase-like domain-containing protein n=1 Tax=Lentinula lateritia TaxID=40482 RepID=A0ABQ8VEE6_9AGAR|nr:kinase-like domain-containing protein [Lentinula lateritia]